MVIRLVDDRCGGRLVVKVPQAVAECSLGVVTFLPVELWLVRNRGGGALEGTVKFETVKEFTSVVDCCGTTSSEGLEFLFKFFPFLLIHAFPSRFGLSPLLVVELVRLADLRGKATFRGTSEVTLSFPGVRIDLVLAVNWICTE